MKPAAISRSRAACVAGCSSSVATSTARGVSLARARRHGFGHGAAIDDDVVVGARQRFERHRKTRRRQHRCVHALHPAGGDKMHARETVARHDLAERGVAAHEIGNARRIRIGRQDREIGAFERKIDKHDPRALLHQRARKTERGIGRADIARHADHGDAAARLPDPAQGQREIADRNGGGFRRRLAPRLSPPSPVPPSRQRFCARTQQLEQRESAGRAPAVRAGRLFRDRAPVLRRAASRRSRSATWQGTW